MTNTNHGIQITGGTVNGPVAAGKGARAVQHVGTPPGDDRATELIALVRDLTRRHADELGDIRPVLRETDLLEAELLEENPDPAHLSDTLTRLSGRVASVAAVAEAVTALIALLSS
ncbi:DUF5955 family protein [Streptosporangium sp. NPDC002721]|uniref:DUF5955 family protein n=1 Tax=Streptosporangium sp. NPDC002721 TaxID=3366188 RepID=UPI0036999F24